MDYEEFTGKAAPKTKGHPESPLVAYVEALEIATPVVVDCEGRDPNVVKRNIGRIAASRGIPVAFYVEPSEPPVLWACRVRDDDAARLIPRIAKEQRMKALDPDKINSRAKALRTNAQLQANGEPVSDGDDREPFKPTGKPVWIDYTTEFDKACNLRVPGKGPTRMCARVGRHFGDHMSINQILENNRSVEAMLRPTEASA